MSKDNVNYGSGIGPYKPIMPVIIPIDYSVAGLNSEDSRFGMADVEAVDMDRVRLIKGGIAPELAFTQLPLGGVANNSPVLKLMAFKTTANRVIVRMFFDHWEWYNGSTWVAVPGAIGGLAGQRPYAVQMSGKLIASYSNTRLKAWDGVPANAVADLSGEAPKALFVTRIGQRLMVANVSMILANDRDPNGVAWSSDGDIAEWTDVSLGAGLLPVQPEGTSSAANDITGMSNIERGVLIYRERTLVMASRTGVRAAPFRFATIDFAHGTESPHSIANGGLALGDFFLGYDFTVYHFDGQNPPVGVGLNIQRRLQERIGDITECVGFINPLEMTYHLLSPSPESSSPLLVDEHVFSIRDYIRRQKLIWSYRSLSIPVSTAAYVPAITEVVSPFVDTFTTDNDRVDPTDAPFHVASATYIPPTGVVVRSSLGSWGLDEPLYGQAPTPDTSFSDASGGGWAQTNGHLDKLIAAGARTYGRITGGSNTQTMVNYPTDRRFSIPKWKGFIDTFVAAVRAIPGGEAKMRSAVRNKNMLGVMGFDDFLFGGTTQNAYLNSLTYEEVEECSAYLKSYWPWMPIGGRGSLVTLKAIAAAPAAPGNPFANDASRIGGVRQYKYFDFGLAQYRIRNRLYDVAGNVTREGVDGSPAAYVALHKAAGIACGIGISGGCNMSAQGSGTDPDWGCITVPNVAAACAFSPRELTEIGVAFWADPATSGFFVWAWYPDLGAYQARPEIQTSLSGLYATALTRTDGLLNIRGDLVAA